METTKPTDDFNRDAGALAVGPGIHLPGTGIGAVAGGAAGIGGAIAAGAVLGTAAGPVGTAIGAAVGAAVGGLVGNGIAEGMNPIVKEKGIDGGVTPPGHS